MDSMRVKDLKSIINDLPDDMLIVIPVVDEDDVNHIYGFRKVRVAGVLVCEGEDDREVFCLNGATDEKDISDQIHNSGRDVGVKSVLYGPFKEEVSGGVSLIDGHVD